MSITGGEAFYRSVQLSKHVRKQEEKNFTEFSRQVRKQKEKHNTEVFKKDRKQDTLLLSFLFSRGDDCQY